MKRFFYFFFLIFLTAESCAAVSAVSVVARAFVKDAAVGDEIRLVLRVEHPKTYSITPPTTDLKLAPFEIKGIEVSPVVRGKNRVVETFTIILTIFETGDFQVPPIAIEYLDGSGKKGKTLTDPVAVKVTSVLKNPSGKLELRPIKGPVSMDLRKLWPLIFGALASILFVVLVVKIIWRIRRRIPIDPETLKPPHERAMLEFGRLKNKRLLESGKVKDYYSELSDILRRYLERRYELAVLDWTTTEIVTELKGREFPSPILERVKELLENADLVKFAKLVPPRNLADTFEEALRQIVESTKPEPQARPEHALR